MRVAAGLVFLALVACGPSGYARAVRIAHVAPFGGTIVYGGPDGHTFANAMMREYCGRGAVEVLETGDGDVVTGAVAHGAGPNVVVARTTRRRERAVAFRCGEPPPEVVPPMRAIPPEAPRTAGDVPLLDPYAK